MQIQIVTPTKAYIVMNAEERSALSSYFRYKNTSVEIMLKKHEHKQWLKRKNYEQWEWEKKQLIEKVNCSNLFQDSGGEWIRPGLIPYIQNIIPNIQVTNNINYPELKPIAWANKLPFEPYYYQIESVKALLEVLHGGVSLATGLGKTACLQMLARQIGDCVVVTPSQSIYSELMESFTYLFGSGVVGGYGDGSKKFKKITIAIAKSLTTIKEGTEAWNFFSKKKAFLCDESHTIPAETLEEVCHGLLGNVPIRLFVSATQVRGDGTQKLLDSIIGKVVYSMDIGEGIRGGFLCPLKFSIVPTFTPDTRTPYDPIENNRLHFLRNPEIANLCATIANAKWNNFQESTLILVEELEQIQMVGKLLTIPYSYVHSGSSKEAKENGIKAVNTQDEILRFNKGEVRCLIGTKAISTGTNLFPTHNTINWSGGTSEIKVKQGPMGRSTRKLENSKFKQFHKPKEHSMIYDFKVTNNFLLQDQLQKRIEFYKESGGEITYF